MILIYAVTAMALDLLIGFGGQISVGHAGFLAIGSYSVALLSTKLSLPLIITLPLAGVIAGLIGFIIGLPAVRLSGQFLAVVTLGFGLSIPRLAFYWSDFTGGYSGISIIQSSLLSNKLVLFYVIVIIVILITWIIYNIINSQLGRIFMAIRESEVAAQATGINVAFYKALMFATSAFFTGLAGGLYAYWIGFVSPNDFTIVTSFLVLGMIVVGGLASIPGAIIGAVIFTLIPELTSSLIGLTNLIIGFAIVIMILFRPKGLISALPIVKKKEDKSEKQSNKRFN